MNFNLIFADVPKCDKIETVETVKKDTNCKKAKLMRIKRRNEKLAQKGMPLEYCKPKLCKSLKKTLEDFLSEEQPNGTYKLKVCMIISIKHSY